MDDVEALQKRHDDFDNSLAVQDERLKAFSEAADKLIAANPAAVKAFVEATAKGWDDYLNGDPKPADALILKDNPEMTQDVLDQARAKLKSYAIVNGGDAKTGGTGAMTDAGWKAFFDMASDQGVFPKTLDYRKGYSLEFLPPAPAAK